MNDSKRSDKTIGKKKPQKVVKQTNPIPKAPIPKGGDRYPYKQERSK